MDKHALWKWLLLAGLAAWSLALILPVDRNVKLGLDLRGGTSFTLEIDRTELEKQIREQSPDLTPEQAASSALESVRNARKQALEIIRNRVDSLGVAEPMIYPEKDDRVVVQIPGLKDSDRERARDLIQSAAFLEFSMVHENNDKLVDALFEKGLAPPGYKIVSVDMKGRSSQFYKREDAGAAANPDGEKEARELLRRFQAPPGYQFMLKQEAERGQSLYVPYLVRQRCEMRGDTVKNAGYEYDQMGRPYVTLKFDAKGSRQFARVTREFAPGGERNPSPEGRRYLAIILDGTLYSAPYIKTAIYGGEAVIEGDFTLEEAQNLAIVLRAGSLPAPVKIIESRSVDPTLGKDSIESGVRATIYSCIAIVVFMIAYYLLAGVIADIALLFNMLLLPLGMMIAAGIMGLFISDVVSAGRGMSLPVLTLPGIAGIALTFGMAVDANILIFERIREEQNLGKRLGPAVEAGYDKAFLAIFDSNLTTIISAIILFVFGTGAVRGFGVTLTAGILVSMYTALVVTRMIFNVMTTRLGVSSLKMFTLIKGTNINFIGWRKPAAALSLIVIAGSWGFMVWRGMSNPSAILGADFTGGASVTFSFEQKPAVEAVRRALASEGINDAHIQYQKELDKNEEFLQVRVARGAGDAATGAGDRTRDVLLRQFKEHGLAVKSQDDVGAQVGAEMVRRAVGSLALALIGMAVYVSFRFRFAFAVGAMVALAHDVLVCAGLYCLAGRQINMPTIAALLAIVGYSVNDTIVIFDRIRENMSRYRDRPFIQVCNLSINETLSRTILTSLTTLMAAVLLFIFGGGAINDFALVFVIGMIAGTYSTVYIATPVAMALRAGKRTEKPGSGSR